MLRGLSPTGKITLGVVAAVVVAVLGFTIGVAVGRPNYPGDDSPEVGFLRDMSAHHAQAVEMAMIAYQKASRADVRSLASDIAMTQKGQIGRMQGWLVLWGIDTNTPEHPMAWLPNGAAMMNGNRMPGMATREEITQLQSATGEQVDILFLQLMGRHHVGGIHMVQGLLDLNPSPSEVKALAEEMKSAQEREIAVMTPILAELHASPLPD
jgi:uncharacterized protein (DUF305 family)